MIIGMQYAWLAIMVFFLILEAFTMGLTTIWFAGGALAAAVGAFFGLGLVYQLLLFVVVALIMVVLMRPIAVKYMNKNVTRTNVDSMIGEKALVIQEINNLASTGKVKIADIEWKARTADDSDIIPEGTIVEVEKVSGVKLIVQKHVKGETL